MESDNKDKDSNDEVNNPLYLSLNNQKQEEEGRGGGRR